MCVGIWCLTAVFASATADAETDGKCHRGQARRARQEPDALRFEREITVFPALAQTYTKHDDTCTLEACLGESVEFMERSDSGTEEITQSRPLGAIAANLDRPRKIWKTWSKAERLSSLERIKRSIIKHIGHSRYLAYGGLS